MLGKNVFSYGIILFCRLARIASLCFLLDSLCWLPPCFLLQLFISDFNLIFRWKMENWQRKINGVIAHHWRRWFLYLFASLLLCLFAFYHLLGILLISELWYGIEIIWDCCLVRLYFMSVYLLVLWGLRFILVRKRRIIGIRTRERFNRWTLKTQWDHC